MPELHCFFVLTRTSVYKISDEKNLQGFPLVEKIAMKGQSGVPIGGLLEGGCCVGLAGEAGVVVYDPNTSRESRGPEVVNPVLWGSKTSPIIGLFLQEVDAREALITPDLKTNDPRFQEESARVLGAIGTDHPVFVISELHYKNSAPEV